MTTTAAVAGIGQTRYARDMGRSELDLACEAIGNACADAGIAVHDVDGFVSYHVEQVAEVELLTTFGIPELRFMARTPSGGGGAASILGLAALAVERGTAECVVAFRARNRSKQASYGADPNQGGRPWAKGGARLRDFAPVAPPVRCRFARAGDGADRAAAHARLRDARRALRYAGGRATLPRQRATRTRSCARR